MAQRSAHDLKVPLSGEVHRRLRAEAARSGRPATALAREAIESWVKERGRRAIDQAVVDYAEQMAGSRADLDRELEAAGVEHLVSTRRRR